MQLWSRALFGGFLQIDYFLVGAMVVLVVDIVVVVTYCCFFNFFLRFLLLYEDVLSGSGFNTERLASSLECDRGQPRRCVRLDVGPFSARAEKSGTSTENQLREDVGVSPVTCLALRSKTVIVSFAIPLKDEVGNWTYGLWTTHTDTTLEQTHAY